MKKEDMIEAQAFFAEYYKLHNIPGLQICVYEDNKIVYQNSFGTKNSNGDALSNNTVMGIASITKTITALAISIICSQGKMSVDDAVIKYFPHLKIPGTPAESLLVAHLLNHTSGIPAQVLHSWCVLGHTEPDKWEKAAFDEAKASVQWGCESAEDIVRYLSESGHYKTVGQPGMFFSYLNEGYALLTAIIQKVSGMSYEAYVKKNIFDPLDMVHSAFGPKGISDITSLFYSPEGPASDSWYCAPPYIGTGYVVSTAEDVARLFSVLSSGGQYKGRQIFSSETVERLAGEAFPLSEKGVYCFGVHKRHRNNQVLLRHNGSLKGVSSAAGCVMGGDRSYAIIANLEGAHINDAENVLQNIITDAPIHSLPYSPKPLANIMPECAQSYAGTYQIMEDLGYTIKVSILNNVLVGAFSSVLSGDQGQIEFQYCGTTIFSEVSDHLFKRVLEFYFDQDRAIGVQYGGRFYQRRE